MTNGQPSGTQESGTLAGTDSAATENNTLNAAEAMLAEAAAHQAWLTEFYGEHAAAARESGVNYDTAQLLAVGGRSYVAVARDSITQLPATGLEVDGMYEMYTADQLDYAKSVVRLMRRLIAGDTVSSAFEYRRPYLKQRQLVKVVSPLQANPDGKMGYQVYLGTLDPRQPLAEPVWRTQDQAGGVWGDIYLYPQQTATGTRYTRYRGSSLEVAVLGVSDVMTSAITDVLAGELYKQFTEVVSTDPSLKADSIRRATRGQLVFWQAQSVCVATQAALAAAEQPAVNPAS